MISIPIFFNALFLAFSTKKHKCFKLLEIHVTVKIGGLEKEKIGGLGIHIVKKLMDGIWYERKRGRNKLTLKKYIHSTSHLYKRGKASRIPSNYFA